MPMEQKLEIELIDRNDGRRRPNFKRSNRKTLSVDLSLTDSRRTKSALGRDLGCFEGATYKRLFGEDWIVPDPGDSFQSLRRKRTFQFRRDDLVQVIEVSEAHDNCRDIRMRHAEPQRCLGRGAVFL